MKWWFSLHIKMCSTCNTLVLSEFRLILELNKKKRNPLGYQTGLPDDYRGKTKFDIVAHGCGSDGAGSKLRMRLKAEREIRGLGVSYAFLRQICAAVLLTKRW